MRKMITAILLFVLPGALLPQQVIFARFKASVGGTPTFVAYTFVVETNAASITSPALTLSSNDGIFVECGSSYSGGTPTALVATSTPSHTFTAQTIQGTGNVWGQLSVGVGFSSGSTTFKCTPTGTAAYLDMVVLQYHNMPSNTVNTSVGGNVSGSATFTSPSFTTSQRTLIVECAIANANVTTWAAGNIAGTLATLRGVNGGATLGSSSWSACEDYLSTTAVTAQTGTISVAPGSLTMGGTLIAINY